MKVANKIILIIIAILLAGTIFSSNTFAVADWDTMKNQADAFITQGKNQGGDTVISEQSLQEFTMPIARALVSAAAVVIIVVTVVVGIQYLMASPNDKAKLKQKLVGLVISAIVVFGAVGIWSMLYDFMESATR